MNFETLPSAAKKLEYAVKSVSSLLLTVPTFSKALHQPFISRESQKRTVVPRSYLESTFLDQKTDV